MLLNPAQCQRCNAAWTFQGTGYCGPCLGVLNAIPKPIALGAASSAPSINPSINPVHVLMRCMQHWDELNSEVPGTVARNLFDSLDDALAEVWSTARYLDYLDLEDKPSLVEEAGV